MSWAGEGASSREMVGRMDLQQLCCVGGKATILRISPCCCGESLARCPPMRPY